MKITMYELLGMVKDGKAPKKIRFDNMKWRRINGKKCVYYINDYDNDLFIYFFKKNLTFTLKDEVEILDDEEKELPEKINDWISTVGRVDDSNIEEYVHILFEQQTQLYCKINQLIDYLEKQRKGDE